MDKNEADLVLEYILPKDFKVSTNQVYAWMHWAKRKRHADFFHRLVYKDCLEFWEKIKGKVDILIEFRFKSKYLDSSNCSYMAKMIEDGIKKGGLIEDDTNEFVWRFCIESIKLTKEERKELRNDTITVYIMKRK